MFDFLLKQFTQNFCHSSNPKNLTPENCIATHYILINMWHFLFIIMIYHTRILNYYQFSRFLSHSLILSLSRLSHWVWHCDTAEIKILFSRLNCIMFQCVIICFVISLLLNAIPFRCLIFANWYVCQFVCVCLLISFSRNVALGTWWRIARIRYALFTTDHLSGQTF